MRIIAERGDGRKCGTGGGGGGSIKALCYGTRRHLMPVSHYGESPGDPLGILLVYAQTLGGSTGDPQGIFSNVTLA